MEDTNYPIPQEASQINSAAKPQATKGGINNVVTMPIHSLIADKDYPSGAAPRQRASASGTSPLVLPRALSSLAVASILSKLYCCEYAQRVSYPGTLAICI